jgi:hypothetical protein
MAGPEIAKGSIPSAPARSNNPIVRGVSGDVRVIPAVGQAAQVVDVEFQAPGAFLVIGQASALGNWTIRTGIERAPLAETVPPVSTDFLSQIVLARSISVVFTSTFANTTVSCVVVPVDPTFDVATFINSAAGGFIVNPILLSQNATVFGRAANVASISLDNNVVATRGWGIHNHSPAGANLFIRLGTTNASIASGGYTQRIQPDGYYETPFGYTGKIQGIWDAADAAGFANMTAL